MQTTSGREHNENLSVSTPARRPSVAADEALRRCIVSGETLPKAEMLRFVLSPDLIVTFDIREKLPGRGLWVRADKDSLNSAIQKNAFAKAAKSKAIIPENLSALVPGTVYKQLIDCLCMANRAGLLAAGADQCLEALRKGTAGVYITASDKGSETRQRIESKNPSLPLIDYIDRGELGRIIGKDELTHMIVKKGNLCLNGVHWHQLYEKLN